MDPYRVPKPSGPTTKRALRRARAQEWREDNKLALQFLGWGLLAVMVIALTVWLGVRDFRQSKEQKSLDRVEAMKKQEEARETCTKQCHFRDAEYSVWLKSDQMCLCSRTPMFGPLED